MLPLSWIDALFTKFETMYGQQFIDKWKNCDIDQVKQTWAEELGGMSGDRIKKALSDCNEVCKYPPNLPEFYQLCRAVMIYSKPIEQQIEHKQSYCTPEIARSRLQELKEMLKNSNMLKGDDNA